MLAKRNRLMFRTAAAIFLGLVVAVIGATWGMVAADAAADAESKQRLIAQEQRDRADRLFKQGHELAQIAMDDFYKEIIDLPGTLPARRLLVEEALSYLEVIEKEAGEDVSLQLDVALGHRRIGQMLGGTRDPSLNLAGDAIKHYEAALTINDRILAADPENQENLRGLVADYIYLGDALNSRRERDQALQSYEEALRISAGLFAAEPDSGDNRRLVAIAELKVGDVKRVIQSLDAAEPHYLRSLELREARAVEEPGDEEAIHDLTVGHTRIAQLLKSRADSLDGEPETATDLYERAIGHYEFALENRTGIAERDPQSTRRLRDVMKIHLEMAPLLNAMQDMDGTTLHLREALLIAERLYDCDSRDERTRTQLAKTRQLYGFAMVNAGQFEEGIVYIEMALAEYEALAIDFPDDPRVNRTLQLLRKVWADLDGDGGEESDE